MGAYLNVRINVPGLTDTETAAAYLEHGRTIQAEVIVREAAILASVDDRL
jgi:formiminotetrahydrofolate cyclodeaminase